jgi:hypothetical protein
MRHRALHLQLDGLLRRARAERSPRSALLLAGACGSRGGLRALRHGIRDSQSGANVLQRPLSDGRLRAARRRMESRAELAIQQGGEHGRRRVGKQAQGVEPAFRLDCPGCEQQTVWVDVRHNRYVSIEFIPIPAGTGHVVMCSECGLATRCDLLAMKPERGSAALAVRTSLKPPPGQ